MMYTTKEGVRGFYFMDTESAKEATLIQTGLTLSDFNEISEEDYKNWCSPPEGYYSIFDENGPRVEKNPVKTAEQHQQEAQAEKIQRLYEAANLMAPLQDAVDIGEATEEEEAAIKDWKKYRVAVNRIDLTKAPDITWPEKPAS
ncbi:tail fiber assembly protein [Pantoea eucalypti]|uniref:tail fiber assembly protein n=1 Tax=Pantoea TaxID=53335 RepID=UPI000D783EEE|nr:MULTISPECIES: tail fiber assembly protein [Pantoea]AWP32198.1 phage tail protein [Pantoea vagans]